MATRVIDHCWNVFLSVPKIGQYFTTFGETISDNDFDAIVCCAIILLV